MNKSWGSLIVLIPNPILLEDSTRIPEHVESHYLIHFLSRDCPILTGPYSSAGLAKALFYYLCLAMPGVSGWLIGQGDLRPPYHNHFPKYFQLMEVFLLHQEWKALTSTKVNSNQQPIA